jgi:hypothetical protein
MPALIAFERARLDAGHHHSGSAILAPGAPFDDLQRTRNKLGLPHVSGGSVSGLSATDAWHRAGPVMRHVQHLSLESLVKMDHFQKEPPLNLKGTTGAHGGSKGAST